MRGNLSCTVSEERGGMVTFPLDSNSTRVGDTATTGDCGSGST